MAVVLVSVVDTDGCCSCFSYLADMLLAGCSSEEVKKTVYQIKRKYSQTCIKRSSLGQRKSGLIRHVTS